MSRETSDRPNWTYWTYRGLGAWFDRRHDHSLEFESGLANLKKAAEGR